MLASAVRTKTTTGARRWNTSGSEASVVNTTVAAVTSPWSCPAARSATVPANTSSARPTSLSLGIRDRA